MRSKKVNVIIERGSSVYEEPLFFREKGRNVDYINV